MTAVAKGASADVRTARGKKCREHFSCADLIEGYCAECIAGAISAIVEVVALPSVTAETVSIEEAVDELRHQTQPHLYRGLPGVA